MSKTYYAHVKNILCTCQKHTMHILKTYYAHVSETKIQREYFTAVVTTQVRNFNLTISYVMFTFATKFLNFTCNTKMTNLKHQSTTLKDEGNRVSRRFGLARRCEPSIVFWAS